jgi:SSS family transporter
LIARQSMSWLPVGLSLMAALNSGIDYLMQPSATIRFGLVLLVGTASWVFLYPWVARVTLPFYRRLNAYTAYEFLEARFDVRVRTLAAAMFIVWRVGWMATAIYVPCLAIDAAVAGRVDIHLLIIVLGIVVTLYTMLGGIEAVIWNDVIQFCVMFGGLGATVWLTMTRVPGGITEVWSSMHLAGAAATPPPPAAGLFGHIAAYFIQPVSFSAILITMILGRMASYTSDQVMVQRMQTTKSLADARRAYVINAAGDALWMFGLSFVGLSLLAYFQHHALPDAYATDRILPYFMAQAFPTGAIGLVIAAILAASLSSVDSAINSCTSVLVVDVYQRLIVGRQATTPEEERRAIRVSRVATVLLGISGTVLALNVARVGTLLEIAGKVINAFSGPLFGIYLVAMFNRRATGNVALVAGLLGSIVSYVVAYRSPISFLWPATFGLAATVLVAAVLGLVVRDRSAEHQALTWSAVMRAPSQAGAV